MSRKHRRKKKHKTQGGASQGSPAKAQQTQGAGAPVPSAGAPATAPWDAVARLISAGRARDALRQARALHKEQASPASERLLVEAYAGRIREMLDHGMAPEADALVRLVRERYPASAGRLEALASELTARGGDLADLVGPLADASLPQGKRAEIEAALRRVLTDPAELAACEALPPDHPLRAGARAVGAALAAATQGPVDDAAAALPEVPRRGPLAPWKWLVRAIAAFYRRDDEACAKCLGAIEADSAPARLVPVLRAVSGGGAAAQLPRRERELADRLTRSFAPLQKAVSDLDGALDRRRSRGRVLHAIRQAVAECRRAFPEGVERLRQRISIRAYLAGLGGDEVQRAIGGGALHDAAFWRLMAMATEMRGAPATACAYWEEFRKHAVHQGWFPAEGAEVAVLFRRMLGLLDRSLPEEIDELLRRVLFNPGWLSTYYNGQPPAVAAAQANRLDAPPDYFVRPGYLYPLVCRLDPDPKVFEDWLGWAEEAEGVKEAEAVALRWGAAFPQAARPFLHLADACEKRDALKRALKFLSEAEARDPLNPEVRRARLRLLAATARRHLKQGKPHLLAKDCAELEALPQATERDRPAFLAAARCLLALLERNRPEADRWRDETARVLGDPAAFYLLASLHDVVADDAPEPNFPTEPPAEADGATLAAAAARACALGEDLGMPFALAPTWGQRLEADLKPEACPLDAAALRTLAEAALRADDGEVAYRLSGIGLARGGSAAARFLLLRARSIPTWHGLRRSQCFDAVKALAQRQRDTELLGEAIDLSRGRTRSRRAFWLDLLPVPERSDMPHAEAQEVIARELAAGEYPDSVWDTAEEEPLAGGVPDWLDDDDIEDEPDGECDCPDCRRRREEEARKADAKTPFLFDIDPFLVEQRDDIEEEDGEEFFDEDDLPDDLGLPPLPPAVVKLMIEELTRATARGEAPDVNRVIDRMYDKLDDVIPGFRPPKSRRRKKRK